MDRKSMCDICSDYADGVYFSESHLNGEVYREYSCPLSLCEDHMAIWAKYFPDTAVERYEDDNTDRAKLVDDILAIEDKLKER